MSNPAGALKPKLPCKTCGKPFDPEEGQEICNDCQARRAFLWALGLVAALLLLTVVLPMLIRYWSAPRPQ